MRKLYTKLLAVIAVLLLSTNVQAQTFFWTETFGLSVCNQLCQLPYTGINGTWTWVSTGINGSSANTWYLSKQEKGQGRTVCGASGAPVSLHIGNVSTSPAAFFFCPTGDCGAAYDAGIGDGEVTTNARATSPVINCTGQNTITLSFNYIMNGQAAKDLCTVWYFDGAIWSLLASPARTARCGAQGKWTYFSVAMPASANNNPNVQIGFNWTNNDDGAGNDPSFAVDSVRLSVPAVLPVELLSFDAVYDNNDNKVNLTWSTASETNNALFTVQRSTDGETFTDALTKKGAGNSSQTLYYDGADETILGGTVYYRLMQTDYDGHFAYSKIVPVDENNSGHMQVYPDPATSMINVNYFTATAGETCLLGITDCTGRMVSSQNIVSNVGGENTAKLNLNGLEKGVYVIRLDIQGKTFFNKFIKQ